MLNKKINFRIFNFFLIIFFYSINVCFAQTLHIFDGLENKYELIDQNFQESFLLNDISFNSDVYFENDEFFYLTGLKKGCKISCLDLKNAFFYLKQKNKFENIYLEVQDAQMGKNLHFVFHSCFAFSKIKINGILFGKDKYAKHYLIEQGEQFDQIKHENSIEKLKKEFFGEGYFEVKIVSKFNYDNINKLVAVELDINRGQYFSVSDIKFEIKNSNLNEIDLALIRSKIERKLIKFPRGAYSGNVLKHEKKSLNDYIKRNGFPFCQISIKKIINYKQKKIILNFEINLNDKKEFRFLGNQYFSDSYLTDFLFDQGQQILDMPVSILAEEICQLYKDKGFWQAIVEQFEEQNCYKFIIKEGKRASVEKFIIKGYSHVEAKTIINKFFKPLSKLKYINNESLSQSIDNLTIFYLKLGFWDIKINKNLIPGCIDGKYIIEIILDEGKQKFLKSVSIENFKELETENIFLKIKNIKKPIPFDFNLLNEQHKFLTDYVRKQGYKKFEIKPEFIADDDGAISLIWKMNVEKQTAKFGKTIVQGNNSFIPFYRIKREIKYNSGEPFEKEKLEETYRQFNDFNYFQSIHLYPASNFDFDENKPIILKLFPDDPFEIKTRFGFQQVSKNFTILHGGWTYRAGGSFLYKNPTGCFDQFKIDADYSKYTQMLVAQYNIPSIFSLPIKSLFQFYLTKYKQPIFIGSDKTLYEINQIGFLTGFIKKFRKINLGINTGFEFAKITDLLPGPARAIDFSPRLLNKSIPYLFCEPNLFIDHLDDKLNPTSGYLTAVSIKAMASLQDKSDYYFRFLIEQSFFHKFYSSIILGLRFRLGHIFTPVFSRLLPPFRFYLGGPQSLRSYEPDFAPPLGVYINENGEPQRVPKGGRTMFNGNIEFRFPTTKNLEFVLFQDFGLLFINSQDCAAKNLLSATGIGLRYFTPIGPLRFDIGFGPARGIKDSSFAWFLTLGQAF